MKFRILQLTAHQHEVFTACHVDWSQLKILKVSNHVKYETTKIPEKNTDRNIQWYNHFGALIQWFLI